MSNKQTIFLDNGIRLTVTSDAFTSGHYYTQNPGQEPSNTTAISASSITVIEPTNDERQFIFETSGELTFVKDDATASPDGASGITSIVEDTTPQLGGNLDRNGFTIDGRVPSTDGIKLDAIEANADVTDAVNVQSSLDGATIPTAIVAGTDKVMLQDVSDADNLKTVTAQAIADLAPSGGINDIIEDVTPQLGGNLDRNGFTIDGRVPSTDGTKLDGIETSADVTDAVNVQSSLDGAAIPTATVAGTDKVMLQDVSDADNLKTVTAQAIADLAPSGGINDIIEDVTPQLGGNLDRNGFTIDGRIPSTDGTKLDAIEASADVTDAANVQSSLDGAVIPTTTVAGTDKVMLQDVSDSSTLKTVTAQAIADLGGGGGGGAGTILQVGSFSTVSGVNAKSSLDNTYDEYEIRIKAKNFTALTFFTLKFYTSTNTLISAAYFTPTIQQIGTTAFSGFPAASASSIDLTNGFAIKSLNTTSAFIIVRIRAPSTAEHTYIQYKTTFRTEQINASNGYSMVLGSGVLENTSILDGFQIQPSSGLVDIEYELVGLHKVV